MARATSVARAVRAMTKKYMIGFSTPKIQIRHIHVRLGRGSNGAKVRQQSGDRYEGWRS